MLTRRHFVLAGSAAIAGLVASGRRVARAQAPAGPVRFLAVRTPHGVDRDFWIPRNSDGSEPRTEDEALSACDKHTIALAIVDLQLAQGTGFGVIRRLRAATGANPACIVVLTNHAVPALKVAAFEAGADYFLDKSKDFATIPRLIGELLNGKGSN